MYLLYKNVSNFIICLTLCVKFYYLNVSNLCYVIWYRIKHKAGGVKWQRKQKWVIKVATLFRKKLMSKVFPIEKRGKLEKGKVLKFSHIYNSYKSRLASLSRSRHVSWKWFLKKFTRTFQSRLVSTFSYTYTTTTQKAWIINFIIISKSFPFVRLFSVVSLPCFNSNYCLNTYTQSSASFFWTF